MASKIPRGFGDVRKGDKMGTSRERTHPYQKKDDSKKIAANETETH